MASELERIAKLEADARHVETRLENIELILAGIKATLDQMKGGKRALLGLFGLVGSAVAILGSIFSWKIGG